jgi:hypothetical protein
MRSSRQPTSRWLRTSHPNREVETRCCDRCVLDHLPFLYGPRSPGAAYRPREHALNTKKSRAAVKTLCPPLILPGHATPARRVITCAAPGGRQILNMKLRTRLTVTNPWTAGFFRAFAARVELATCRFLVRTAGGGSGVLSAERRGGPPTGGICTTGLDAAFQVLNIQGCPMSGECKPQAQKRPGWCSSKRRLRQRRGTKRLSSALALADLTEDCQWIEGPLPCMPVKGRGALDH